MSVVTSIGDFQTGFGRAGRAWLRLSSPASACGRAARTRWLCWRGERLASRGRVGVPRAGVDTCWRRVMCWTAGPGWVVGAGPGFAGAGVLACLAGAGRR
ncbi:MAG: hypothetical protein OXF54_15285 [Caldilineaceae bacterium]|nr:hypothetical protein [Caldilineaceae bacterium]